MTGEARDRESIVPGEVVIRVVDAATNEPATRLVAALPSYVRASDAVAGEAPVALGVPGLDRVLSELGAVALYRVHEPELTGVDPDDPGPFAPLVNLAVVRFDPGVAPADAVAALNELPEVAEAAPHRVSRGRYHPDDPKFSDQWGTIAIRCPEVWDRTHGDRSVTIAFLDTGLDWNHEDVGQGIVSYDGFDPLKDAQDDNGHGTSVFGVVGAIANNSIDVAGAAWECRFAVAKVLNAKEVGENAIIAKGVQWALGPRGRAQILNCSFGGPKTDPIEKAWVDVATIAGALIVTVMGNKRDKPDYPGRFAEGNDHVVAVSAVSEDLSLWEDSSIGAWNTVAAPGVGIRSLKWRGGTSRSTGTSMAAPFVSAVAGLILSRFPKLKAGDVKRRIMATATPLRDHASDPVPNPEYGAGLVDAAAAVSRLRLAVVQPGRRWLRTTEAPHFPDPRTYPQIEIGTSPAFAAYAFEEVVAWQSSEPGHTLLVTSADDGDFPPGDPKKGIEIGTAPALANFDNKLYVVWRANDESHVLWLTYSHDGQAFPRGRALSNITLLTSPALAVFREQLYLAWQAPQKDRRLWMSRMTMTSAGEDFPDRQGFTGMEISEGTSPAMTMYKGRLYVAWRANDGSNKLWLSSFRDPYSFEPPRSYSTLQMGGTPSLGAFDGRLYVAFADPDPKDRSVWVARSRDGVTFDKADKFPDVKTVGDAVLSN